jgi:hypothetical protein
LTAESPTSVDQFHAAFADKDYWLARIAASDTGPGTASLDAFDVDALGNVSVATTVTLLRDELPRLVTQLRRGALKLVHTESWCRVGADCVQGQMSAALSGVPFAASGTAVLTPMNTGCELRFAAAVEVKVAVIGGMVEAFIGSQRADGLAAIQTFTTEWIDDHS